MAETDSANSSVAANADDYDDTIPTPEEADPQDAADPNSAPGESVDDTPPAGVQEPAEGAVNEEGVPLRADGSPARDKSADS